MSLFTRVTSSVMEKLNWRRSGAPRIDENETVKSLLELPQAFPTIIDLAQLAKHVYKSSDPKCPKKYMFKIRSALPTKLDMPDWTCIGKGRYSDGYCGAAYVNLKHSHVVIAHGGTEFFNEFYRDVICTDVGGIVLNKDVSQISSAYIFTKIIVDLYRETQFSISVTGHSLGGWLAQITAFYIEHPTYISQYEKVQKVIDDKLRILNITDYVTGSESKHLHTVSFDSPGCRRALKKIVGYYGSNQIKWEEKVETLDFTVVIAPSNVINTWGEHVGYVLNLEMQGVPKISLGKTSHGIKLFVRNLTSQPLSEVQDVYWGRAVRFENESEDKIILDQWYIGRHNSCQVNVLSPKEIEFLIRAQTILKWKNNESFDSSEWIIKSRRGHKRALKILEAINAESLNDFVQYFNITHSVIEFPKQILDEHNMNMSKLIWKFVRLFRVQRRKRDWLNGTELKNLIQDFPGCRQMLCVSEGSLYIQRIPKLNGRDCTPETFCGRVRTFLEHEQDHFLQMNAGRDGSRLYMVHIFNYFRNCYTDFEKHVLFINKSMVQRLNREIEMGSIFSQTSFSVIVVECDELNDVIRSMIDNVNDKKKKLIIVTTDEDCTPGENGSSLRNDALTLQYNHLNEQSKQVISQCHVRMNGNTVMLGRLLEDVAKFFNADSSGDSSKFICEIFDGIVIDLSSGSLPVMADHYIPRTFYPITLNVKKLGEDFSDSIVVSNSNNSDRELIPNNLSKNNIIHMRDSKYTKKCFLGECELAKFKSGNVHWFKIETVNEKPMLVWQISKGQPCFDYLIDDEGGIPEIALHELQNNFIILADEPGMGKSAAITKLYLEYRNAQFKSIDSKFNWPVYINLSAHQVELKDTENSPVSAISFLIMASNLDCDFKKSLFKFCLEKLGNLTFFIDSFDEISEKGKDFVVRMLELLIALTHSRIRVWIATRNFAKYELEKRLGTKSYRFHRIKEDAQLIFLGNYWTHSIPAEFRNSNRGIKNLNLFEEVIVSFCAQHAIAEIQRVLGKDHTFIGIPLQLVLLAVIYNDRFLQLLENKVRYFCEKGLGLNLSNSDWENSSDKFSSTLELYVAFMNKKIDIWLADKFQFDTRTESMDKALRTWVNEIHSRASFLYASSSILTNSDINVKALSTTDSYEINRVGLCETFVEWRKTMIMPPYVFKCIRRVNTRRKETRMVEIGEHCSDIVFLTFKNENDRDAVHIKIQDVLRSV